MIDQLENPVATAVVTWKSKEAGGRVSGPPTASVYAATCVFLQGGDEEIQPGWPGSADQVSILLEAETDGSGSRGDLYKVDFLVREIARPFLKPEAVFLVMEGPRTVAEGRIQTVHE